MKKLLEGIRIADFSWAAAGPGSTMNLGFTGAEVIKIETSKRPDFLRELAKAYAWEKGVTMGLDGSQEFNDTNLNKLGVTLDLSVPEAVEIAKGIVVVSDIAINSFRPGTMEKLGLGYEELRKVRPDLIYVESSGWGSKGLESRFASYAPSFNAQGGLAYLTGYPDMPPTDIRLPIDLMGAAGNAFAMLTALEYRRRTGRGQLIDNSSIEVVCTMIGDSIMDYTMNKRVQMRHGNRDSVMAPHGVYRCQGNDKWVSIAVGAEEEWQALCKAMDQPELARDPRFADMFTRWQHQDELDAIIASWTSPRAPYEVTRLLQGVGVAAFPSMSSEDIYKDPHLKARGFHATVEHKVLGKQTVMGVPWKFSRTPASVDLPGPLLGEHNERIFHELLGMPKEEIDRLIEQQAMM